MIQLTPTSNGTPEWRRTASDAGDRPVSALEAAVAEYCGAEYAVAFSSKAVALRAAFEALGVGRGNNVVTTSFSAADGANAIRRCGATPTFADVDPETYTLDADNVAHVLRHSDREFAALLVSHAYGLPAEMTPLLELASEYDLAVVADGARSHGAAYDGRRVGTFGDIACFSLPEPPGSPVEAVGALVTNARPLAQRAARFRATGCDSTPGNAHADLGPSEPAAEACRAQLGQRAERVRKRRTNAARLTDRLRSTPVTPPVEPANRRHVYHRYGIRCSNRDRLRRYLASAGIESAVSPSCVHDRPASETDCAFAPIAERVAETVLALPVHSELNEDDVDAVATAVASFDDW